MEDSLAADIFGALAHPTRVTLLRKLISAAPEGMAAGKLAVTLKVAPSTLSHHLAALEHAGLIAHERLSRSLVYSISSPRLRQLTGFLLNDCCGGRPELCGIAIADEKAKTPCP
ncbi:MAG: metalloregulator ArsR/SmtB family transcription factor [Sphingobium sp.]